MKFSNRLIVGTLGVVGVLIIALVLIVDRGLADRARADAVDEMTRQARFIGTQWALTADPQALAHAAGDALKHRVTLIGPDGVVNGDSDFDTAGIKLLENHATRPEVVEARSGAVGVATRPSPSRGDDELYVAVATAKGVARVSLGVAAFSRSVAEARRDVLMAGVIVLLAALFLSWLFARSVSKPVVELRDVAHALAAGDLTQRPTLPATGEIEELGQALRQLAEQLSRRIAELRNEETQLVQLTEALDQGVVTLDPNLMVVRINETGRRQLNLPDAVPFSFDRLPRKRELRDAVQLALRGESTDGLELQVDGRTVNVTVRPLVGRGVVIAVIDLTRLRRLEQVRRDFVGNVSHELRTPITVISGFAETLLHDDLDPERRRQFAERIVSNSQRMQRLVDDLLDLSRIESGGWVPNPTQASTESIAGEATAIAHEAAEAKGVQLSVRIASGAESIWVDPTALRQVLTNLVDNAVRHTSTGTIEVFAEPGPEGGLSVGVRDTGIGIPAEHLPRIFERFYRADPARSREQGGTGLGLAIVKHLVEAHGGSVRAESVPGGGTTVFAWFPAVR